MWNGNVLQKRTVKLLQAHWPELQCNVFIGLSPGESDANTTIRVIYLAIAATASEPYVMFSCIQGDMECKKDETFFVQPK